MPTRGSSPALGHHALRKGRVSLPNGIYHLTVVTADRAAVFADHRAAHAACRCLHDRSLLYEARLLAWVVMPDHAHLLTQLGENKSLPDEVRRLKSLVTLHVNRGTGRQGPLWNAAYHDHALRYDDDVPTVARYIIENPLRAGIVDSIGDYPYWNAIWL